MMLYSPADDGVQKLVTEIPGFDLITNGGLPQGRTTLVAGTAGSAKTVFAAQFLAAGIIKSRQPGVFVTFEESPSDIRSNMRSFRWDIARWETEGIWAFVDVSPPPEAEAMITGSYDFSALLARIEFAVRRIGAVRVSIDSLGAIFSRFPDTALVRSELLRLIAALKSLGITAIITAERPHDYGDITRYGVEEFVADNVILLRNTLEDEKRRRTVEILKFRGTLHQKGEYPFTVVPDAGIAVIPLSAIALMRQKSSTVRVPSGNPELDRMCGSGFFNNSTILVSGATGTGKTLLATQFIVGGARHGERCLLFAFEESEEQLFRNAQGWGVDFARMVQNGMLKVVCEYPEAASLEDHLVSIKETVEAFKPDRLAVDSLSALNRVSTVRGWRELAISLTSFIKEREVTGLFTTTTSPLLGGGSVTETQFSTITDTIILLRYIEMYGEMRRGITVLKMRGSMHEKAIREFTIDGQGMHIGEPFRHVTGILSEVEPLGGLSKGDVPRPA